MSSSRKPGGTSCASGGSGSIVADEDEDHALRLLDREGPEPLPADQLRLSGRADDVDELDRRRTGR